MPPYTPRVVDAELNELLGSAGAVVIEGPKACGKTMTASQQALAVEPALVLEGAKPRLLDEWQLAPELWNQVRRAVDGPDQPGQLLLTGSALPPDDANRHTGAGHPEEADRPAEAGRSTVRRPAASTPTRTAMPG